ncbi:alpha/beta hydrolase [Streptomyces desertarenae]|uniref:Alpha/beta hydrolase n=1 Tax=Streptomyces desertarenae TaxID=2666184 RepID=A0ABW4PTY6_9ACTN
MPEHYAELFRQDFSDLDAAAKSWKNLVEKFSDAQNGSGGKVSGPLHAAGWEGESAHFGFAALEATESKLGTASTNVGLIASVLETLSGRMQAAQRKLRNAVRDAEEAGHTVTADGWVEPKKAVDPRYHNDPDYENIQQEANRDLGMYRSRIGDAISDALTASSQAAEALRQIDPFDLDKRYGGEKAREDAQRVADFMGLEEGSVPDSERPGKNAEWWNGLDDSEKRVYLAALPDRIGALDGLPATVRDQANRTVIDNHLNDYALRENSLGIHERSTYASLQKLKDRLDETEASPEHKKLYVLGIGTEGDGKAIVAMGNPDKADHTAVLVPGTDTDLGSMPGQISRIDRLQDAALAQSPNEDVAVISWLGYDAPEIDGSVASKGRAEEGAADLRGFTEGTRAAHEGGRGHLTVTGHSYGTTMVGVAASGGRGLEADDIIALGSPGMGVDKAADLQVDPDHVWVGATQQDPIVKHASNLTLGINPAREGFGAQPIAVNDGGHSSYWDSGKESLRNQGRIIVGHRPNTGEYYHGKESEINPVGPDGTPLLIPG